VAQPETNADRAVGSRQDCPPHPPEPQDLREPQRNEFLLVHGSRRRQGRRGCRPEACSTVGARTATRSSPSGTQTPGAWRHGADLLGGDALI
jgi:hypothetical protein